MDVEVHLNLVTPWHLFPFLKGMPRVEISVHSIHYLDLIRSFLGNPTGVMARTLGHRPTMELGSGLVSSAQTWFDRFEGEDVGRLYAPWSLHTGLAPDAAGGGFQTLAIAAKAGQVAELARRFPADEDKGV